MLRKALVIGNKEYTDMPLKTPVNDAIDTSNILKNKDFTATLKTDLTIQGQKGRTYMDAPHLSNN